MHEAGHGWLAQEYLMYHFWTPLTGLVAVGKLGWFDGVMGQ